MVAAEHDTRLARLDLVARAVIRRAAPVRYAVAEGDARQAAYRLRYRVAVENGWRPAADLPDRLERDHHDDQAILIVGWSGDDAVATTRVVLPTPGTRLPTEEAFGILIPTGIAADVGRFVVERDHAGPAHQTFAGLLGAAWLEARRFGHHRMCGAFTRGMIALFTRMGFVVNTLGPPADYWGERRLPILVDVMASTENLVNRWDADR
jgi:N-acyl-L-homoserine lactone synthetase